MRKLSDSDLADIVGTTIHGYMIESVRIKRGSYTDSDNYCIVLARTPSGNYVTWQCHLDENDQPTTYWGHYYPEHDAAIRDFDTRDLDDEPEETQERPIPRLFKVRISETLQKIVTVEAASRKQAEQIVSDNWQDSRYVLGAEDFAGVEFTAWENDAGS